MTIPSSINSCYAWNHTKNKSRPIPIVASSSLPRFEPCMSPYMMKCCEHIKHTRRKERCEPTTNIHDLYSTTRGNSTCTTLSVKQERMDMKNQLSHSFQVHEDDLYNEMKTMVKNHRLAQQSKPLSERFDSEKSRLFISNSLTTKFLKENDTCLITIPDDLQISNLIDPCFHLRVGTILELDLMNEECLVQITFENHSKMQVIVPSFCLCLEDRVLYERMKRKRKKILFRRSKEMQESRTNQDDDQIQELSCELKNEENLTSEKSTSRILARNATTLTTNNGKQKPVSTIESRIPKRKYKSC
ncbi:hypothetical protein C9374_011987 [Naegleria lovaniensis]|uniref:Uncharacterized protein n=1 Tax=Naegleria lovaniensis TaxID=51637 RepID=A0AA88GDI0_NAELO|nr:uncharacterized protein C9374_011987 [Naegleria lovaniensis]KAG2373524.1 hypothetical protein C9374_011987 [Naegleria lovaniensis]